MTTPLANLMKYGRRYWRDYQRLKKTKKIFGVNALVSNTINDDFSREVRDFWERSYGKVINPIWHHAISAVTKIEDVRYIPQTSGLRKICRVLMI